jgi:FkbM family methyltransferase
MGRLEHYIDGQALEVQEKWVMQLLGPNAPFNLLEIGACEGENSIRYAQFFPRANIHVFEPLPKNYQAVLQHIAKYQPANLRAHQLCLSEQIGFADFFVSSGRPENATDLEWDYGNKSSSLLPPDRNADYFPWMEFKEKIQVKTDTLDNFCRANGLGEIGFMHIDVQGAELMVLKGGQAMLQHTQAMWIEVSDVPLYQGQALQQDIEDFLRPLGFTKIVDTVAGWSGDQFWVKKDFFVAQKGSLALARLHWGLWRANLQLQARQLLERGARRWGKLKNLVKRRLTGS